MQQITFFKIWLECTYVAISVQRTKKGKQPKGRLQSSVFNFAITSHVFRTGSLLFTVPCVFQQQRSSGITYQRLKLLFIVSRRRDTIPWLGDTKQDILVLSLLLKQTFIHYIRLKLHLSPSRIPSYEQFLRISFCHFHQLAF